MIKKYVTKTTKIEAVQYTGNNIEEIQEFAGAHNICIISKTIDDKKIYGLVKNGWPTTIHKNDFIIKVNNGKFIRCSPTDFINKYDEIVIKESMSTIDMMFEAKKTGLTYINNDMLYSDERGFHDDTGGSWPADSFKTINDILYLEGWKLYD